MKKKHFLSILMTVAFMFLFAIPTFAGTMASRQINQYDMTVTPVTNTLSISFSVSGTGLMNKIGCESIYVYEKSGSRWVLTNSWDEDDSGMSRSNAYSNKNTIYSDSDAGIEYKVVITIYAEDNSDRDTRSKTVFVTGK